jgi:hypothetical protein
MVGRMECKSEGAEKESTGKNGTNNVDELSTANREGLRGRVQHGRRSVVASAKEEEKSERGCGEICRNA